MGWICLYKHEVGEWPAVSEECIIQYYSIADEIGVLHDRLFEFVFALNPTVISLVVLTTFMIMGGLLIISLRHAIYRIGQT